MSFDFTKNYRRIANYYGTEHQLIKLQEECGELWGAIHEYVKDGYAFPDYMHVTEEIADVLIMIQQVIYLLKADDAVGAQILDKIERQLRRMQNEQAQAEDAGR